MNHDSVGTYKFAIFLNVVGILGLIVLVASASVMQWQLNELPCPLCWLQRFGFLAMAYGFILNLRYGFRASHYAIVIISALFVAAVALRQIGLHVIPGSPGFASPILGLHLYTWCFIIAVAGIFITALVLSLDKQYVSQSNISKSFTQILFSLLTIIFMINILSIFIQCGFAACPANPIEYKIKLFF